MDVRLKSNNIPEHKDYAGINQVHIRTDQGEITLTPCSDGSITVDQRKYEGVSPIQTKLLEVTK